MIIYVQTYQIILNLFHLSIVIIVYLPEINNIILI